MHYLKKIKLKLSTFTREGYAWITCYFTHFRDNAINYLIFWQLTTTELIYNLNGETNVHEAMTEASFHH